VRQIHVRHGINVFGDLDHAYSVRGLSCLGILGASEAANSTDKLIAPLCVAAGRWGVVSSTTYGRGRVLPPCESPKAGHLSIWIEGFPPWQKRKSGQQALARPWHALPKGLSARLR